MKPLLPFDLDSDLRRRLGHRLIDLIDDYFAQLPQRPVQLPASRRSFEPLHNPLPEAAADPEAVLEEVTRELIEKGFHVPSANYFGLMNPTPAYVAVLAEALVAALNPQLATMARSQLASKIEQETLRWIGERIGWRGSFDGSFTSGGNEANFSALALALAARFPSATEEGVASIGAQPVFYASAESHHSLDKSAGLLGIGRRALRRIPVNARLEMDLQRLETAIAADISAGKIPFAVVATAGTTNSGAIDDLEGTAAICRQRKLWFHVDGAYGGAATFSDQRRNLLRGIEQADSVTIDPHKWLAMPFAAGVIITSQPEMLSRAFGIATPYMPKTAASLPVDNFKISAQWSRRANAFKLWLTLRIHGRQAYEQHINRQLALAQDFGRWLENSAHFELAAPVRLPILNSRVRLPGAEEKIAAAHLAVVEEVTRDGRRWISETKVAGRSVIRIMIVSYLTGERQIAELQAAMTAAAEKVLGAKAAHSQPVR